jgi:starch-binding outer membrane protein, SusD/RagB family
MGTGADLFGNLVYSQALSDVDNPTLDGQLAVYDSVQKVLSAAITNMASTAETNSPPAASDNVYFGDTGAWTALAHTLKARFYMHTGEVRAGAYAQALAEAQQGISSDAGNYFGAFTSNAAEQNFYYQFEIPAGRGGYLIADEQFVSLLEARNDPRRDEYFDADGGRLSDDRLAPDFQQPFVTYDENTLIWAEAAYRTGDQLTALAKLNEERANHGLAAEAVAGQALLNEILLEKYIADFQLGHEAWNDYKRTCTPNFAPTQPGKKMPGRMYYDPNERLTNTNIPPAGEGFNGARNPNDPPNTVSDGTGAACLAG